MLFHQEVKFSFDCAIKFKRHQLSSAQKLASTQTLASAFLERIRKFQNSKCESDLLRIVDCFINGYGSVNTERIDFSNNY